MRARALPSLSAAAAGVAARAVGAGGAVSAACATWKNSAAADRARMRGVWVFMACLLEVVVEDTGNVSKALTGSAAKRIAITSNFFGTRRHPASPDLDAMPDQRERARGCVPRFHRCRFEADRELRHAEEQL